MRGRKGVCLYMRNEVEESLWRVRVQSWGYRCIPVGEPCFAAILQLQERESCLDALLTARVPVLLLSKGMPLLFGTPGTAWEDERNPAAVRARLHLLTVRKRGPKREQPEPVRALPVPEQMEVRQAA